MRPVRISSTAVGRMAICLSEWHSTGTRGVILMMTACGVGGVELAKHKNLVKKAIVNGENIRCACALIQKEACWCVRIILLK